MLILAGMDIDGQILGSGTSVGIPMPGCACAVCQSPDPLDQRLRASVLLEWDGRACLIDTSADLRQQALRAGMQRLDAVLLTHNHADHIGGLDDVRPFCFKRPPDQPIPLYGFRDHLAWVRRRFDYIWEAKQVGGGLPNITLCPVDAPFDLFGARVTPLPVWHGKEPVYGYRIGDCAYISDVSEIPGETFSLLSGVRLLFLDGLRRRRHSTHFNLDEAVAAARRIGAEETYLTHIAHDCSHAELLRELPAGIRPAYDGQRFRITVQD